MGARSGDKNKVAVLEAELRKAEKDIDVEIRRRLHAEKVTFSYILLKTILLLLC